MNSTDSDPFVVTTSLKIMVPAAAILILAVGGFGNIAMIVAVMKSKKLRTVSNIFTITLMGLSFMVTCYGYPIQMLLDTFLITHQPLCYLLGTSMISISVQFSLVLLFVTLERYIKICVPFKAHAIFTPRNVTVAISILLVYGLLTGMGAGALAWIGKDALWRSRRRCDMVFMIPSGEYILLLMIHWLLPLPIMIIIYVRIFIVVRRHIRAIDEMTPVNAAPAASTVPSKAPVTEPTVNSVAPEQQAASKNPPSLNNRRRLVREVKSAFILFVVVVTYFLCWVPFSIFAVIGFVSGKKLSPESYVAIHCMAYGSGFITPYVYGFGNKEFRNTLASMLLPKRCRKVSEEEKSVPTIYTNE